MSVDKGGGKMHRKYIREIFHGGIHPADSRGFENEEYEKWQNTFTKLYREIQAMLPEDKQKKLGSYVTHIRLCTARLSSTGFATALNWARIL